MMGEAHRHHVLASYDIGRVTAVEIAGVDIRTGERGAGTSMRFASGEFECVGAKHAASAGKAVEFVGNVGKGEENIVLAGPYPEMMPVVGVCPGRNRIVLMERRASVTGMEALSYCRGACDEVAAAQ